MANKVKFGGLYVESVGPVIADSSTVVDPTLNLDAAYLDFDPTGIGYARVGPKRNGPGTSAGTKVRTLNAGTFVDAVTYAADGTPTFAKGPQVATGPTALQAVTATTGTVTDLTVGTQTDRTSMASGEISLNNAKYLRGQTSAHNNNFPLIGMDGGNRVSIDPSAAGIVIGASIAFPATQVASSDPNTLDDYEEGTWTPAIAFGGAAVGVVYTTQDGTYTKIGRQITIRCYLAISSKGSSTGVFTITGLPMANSAHYTAGVLRIGQLTSVAGDIQAYVPTGLSTVTVDQLGTGAVAHLTDANVQGTMDLMLTVTYFV